MPALSTSTLQTESIAVWKFDNSLVTDGQLKVKFYIDIYPWVAGFGNKNAVDGDSVEFVYDSSHWYYYHTIDLVATAVQQ